jgi:hypothetical protein
VRNTTFDSTNLRFEPFDLKDDAERYVNYRRDTWETTYGTLAPPVNWLQMLKETRWRIRAPFSLALIYDTPVGMIELDTKQGADENVGVIEFFYENEYRRPVSPSSFWARPCRCLGRWDATSSECPSVKKTNRRWGFAKSMGLIGWRIRRRRRAHHVLEMDITYNEATMTYNAFLPVSREEMLDRVGTIMIFLLITGDAYVDHPSFGAAVIGRVLEADGFRVAVSGTARLEKRAGFSGIRASEVRGTCRGR